MSELLPCPFCGGVDLRVAHFGYTDPNGMIYFVLCKACGSHGPTHAHHEDRAVAGWNIRAALSAAPAQAPEQCAKNAQSPAPDMFAENAKKSAQAPGREEIALCIRRAMIDGQGDNDIIELATTDIIALLEPRP